ncbi:MAG: VWA domain-containing protein [Acidobacteriota bacterium]|nr:VWA domain-containing protein [Acidobacteriota bacterium]
MLVCLVPALLLTLFPIIGFGQEPASDDEIVRVNTELLLFPIRVRDKRKPEQKLTEADLALKDADRVTTGVYFSAGADRLALVFALDESGSLREIIVQQREAALALFGKFGEKSRVAVMRFSGSPVLVADFGRDLEAVRSAFNFPARPNQRTAIFDAAAAAVRTFDSLPRIRSERHIVILISDGLDNASSAKAESVIKTALNKRVSFYIVHLPLFAPRDGRLAIRSPAKGFRELAEKTGGRFFVAADARSALASTPVNLAPVFKAIEDDLKGQYLIGFYIGEAANDGRKHRFSLSLPAGVEYQFGQLEYSRKHEFFVQRPREALQNRAQ